MDSSSLLNRLAYLPPMILSLSVHEWAHAYSAYRLGDDTAARQGRLTLDPMAHIDPIGTVLLPLMGVPFGWARPVPVNPARFRRDVSMRTGMAITAAAGPLSNLVLAILSAVGLGLYLRFAPTAVVSDGASGAIATLLQLMLVMNVGLALFNLLPVPPLDGSRVMDRFVPYRARPLWEGVVRYAPFILMAIILSPRMLGFSVIDRPFQWVATPLFSLVEFIAAR